MEDPVRTDDPETTRKSRRQRFVEVATRRTTHVIRDLRRLGNCANRSAYSYSEEDVAKIIKAIETELEAVRLRFQPRKDRKEVAFKLD